ncbi:TPA: hypothetical protein ACK1B7_004398 [Serratia marcescens]
MVQRYNPDYVMHAARFAPFAREAEHGEFVKFSDYEALGSELTSSQQINAQTLQVKLTMAETIKELTDRVNALAVENAALKESLESICNAYNEELTDLLDIAVKMAVKLQTPATDAALAAIQARFCELLDTYGKVGPERFNPEFADLYAKIANRIFSSVMDNPHVIDIDSMTEWLEISAIDARAYADMSIKFHAELREAK